MQCILLLKPCERLSYLLRGGMISGFLVSFALSWFSCFVLLYFKQFHQHVSSDEIASGPQKIHHFATPRIGGVPIFLGVLAGCFLLSYLLPQLVWLPFLVTLLPVWLAGIVEDFTKRVSALSRLIAAFVSSLIGMWLMDARIDRLGSDMLDYFLQTYVILSVLLTMVAVGGITHAMNIIDGFNGLAGMSAVMILSALAYVSNVLGDAFLLSQCLILIGATLGFLFWNFPKGSIFAGDGGAYLWGFMIAEISVLLLYRHPEVSPWFPVLLLIYPTWETIFSIYRRKILRGKPVGMPDAMHLHSLVYRRLVKYKIGSKESTHLIRRNSLTAPYLWMMSALSIIPALFIWRDTDWLILCIFLFTIFYCMVYSMIVRFKVRPWLRLTIKL